MNTKIKKFVNVWVRYQQVSKELEELKKSVVEIIPDNGVIVDGYKVTTSERAVFSGVTLETARKFNAVKKVVNTTKLNEALKSGVQVEGVDYTKYINVKGVV